MANMVERKCNHGLAFIRHITTRASTSRVRVWLLVSSSLSTISSIHISEPRFRTLWLLGKSRWRLLQPTAGVWRPSLLRRPAGRVREGPRPICSSTVTWTCACPRNGSCLCRLAQCSSRLPQPEPGAGRFVLPWRHFSHPGLRVESAPFDYSRLPDGHYSADDCVSHYFSCSGQAAWRSRCPAGMVFDPKAPSAPRASLSSRAAASLVLPSSPLCLSPLHHCAVSFPACESRAEILRSKSLSS